MIEKRALELEILGHACVAVRTGEHALLVDPYESGQFGGRMAYRPIDVLADWVVCSHEHLDHAAVDAVPGNPTRVHDGVAGPFTLSRFSLWHDEYGGRRRGGAVDAIRVEAGGFSMLHLSDVGESPRPEVVVANRGVDVLLIPVGGFYTIGAAQAWEWAERIAPRVAVAVHYQTAACTLPIRDEVAFQAWCGASIWNSHRFHVEKRLPDRLIVPPRLA